MENASQSSRLPGLDFLRAIAIVWVMLFHERSDPMPTFLRPIAGFGWMGVDLFFVLSGYLIASQLLKPYAQGGKPSLRDFYLRRFFRIIPVYWAVLAFYIFFPKLVEDSHLTAIWKFLTFTQNLLFDYRYERGFAHAWSLCIEEHFYLLLPCIVFVLMIKPSLRKAAGFLAAVLIAQIAIRCWIWHSVLLPRWGSEDFASTYFQRIYYPTYSQLDGLIMGVTLASIKVFRPEWWRRMTAHGHLWLLAGLLLMALDIALFKGPLNLSTAIGFTVQALGMACLLISSVSTNGWLARYRIPGAAATATLAYSLYLTHPAVMHLARTYLGPHFKYQPFTIPLVFFMSTFMVAGVMYWCIERPFLKLRERISAGMKPATGTLSAASQ